MMERTDRKSRVHHTQSGTGKYRVKGTQSPKRNLRRGDREIFKTELRETVKVGGNQLCPAGHVNQKHIRIPLPILLAPHCLVWFYVNVKSYHDRLRKEKRENMMVERERERERIVFFLYCIVALNPNCVVVGLPLLTD